MSRVCDLTGKRKQVNHKVSHSNIKTKVHKCPNLQTKTIYDPESGQKVRLRVSARALRTLDKVGSLSAFLKKNQHLMEH